MQVGGRRALGATMVAGVLAGGLALGAGAASAATSYCLYDGDRYDTSGLIDAPAIGAACDSLIVKSLTKLPDSPPPTTTEVIPKDTTPTGSPGSGVGSIPTDALPTGTNSSNDEDGASSGQDSPPPVGAGTGQPTNPGPVANGGTAQAPVLVAAGAPVVAALGAKPSGVLPTDLTGTPFEPTLMAAAGIYDPALLLGPGAPTASLQTVGGNPASAVTSASQIQAMALNNPSLGIGATAGVVILAGLGGLVLRQRLMRRVKKAATSS